MKKNIGKEIRKEKYIMDIECSHNQCKSRVKMMQQITNKCRCGKVFCNIHRLPEGHACTIDYVKLGKMALIKDNPKVCAKKLAII